MIGAILIHVAYQLARSARGLIIGEAPPDEILDALRAAIASEPGVEKVSELRAVMMGTKQLLVLARVSVGDDLAAAAAETAARSSPRPATSGAPRGDGFACGAQSIVSLRVGT